MAAVQMNTRIDETLKADGDAVFAELGYSPSEAVRLFWGFAARNSHNKRVVADMIQQLKSPQEARVEQESVSRRQAETARWLDKWDASWQGFFDATGCDPTRYSPLTAEEADEALAEMLDENQERIRLGLSREDYDRILFERWRAKS